MFPKEITTFINLRSISTDDANIQQLEVAVKTSQLESNLQYLLSSMSSKVKATDFKLDIKCSRSSENILLVKGMVLTNLVVVI